MIQSEIIVFYVNELIAWWSTIVQRTGCEFGSQTCMWVRKYVWWAVVRCAQ